MLVIGCGDLGMACARALGKRSRLLLVDVDEARLTASLAALEHDGYAVSGHACDIADAAEVASLGRLLERTGGIRTLAHVAAIGRSSLGWRRILDVNLRGVHLIAQAVAPHMVRGAAAILISSTGSSMTPLTAEVGHVLDAALEAGFHERLEAAFGREPELQEAYNLSKGGMNRLMRRLAVEWGQRQVRVLTVSPGIVDTTMARTGGTELPLADKNGTVRMATWDEVAATTVPLGRKGTILEVGAVVEFMASDAASFVNGIDVPVDGGSLARRLAQAEGASHHLQLEGTLP